MDIQDLSVSPLSPPVHIQSFLETHHCCLLSLLRVSLALCFYPQPLKKITYCCLAYPLLQLHSILKYFIHSYQSTHASPLPLYLQSSLYSLQGLPLPLPAASVCTILPSCSFPPVIFPSFYFIMQFILDLSALCLLFSLPAAFPTTMDLPSKQSV